MDEPVDAGEVTTHKAETAYEKVLAYGGASLHRDDTDKRYASEARTGTVTYTGAIAQTKGIIDLINDPEGTANKATASYPELISESRDSYFDTDGDGMPDAWETANGLNPNDASDGNTTTLDSKGLYTNLEVYMNSLVQEIMVAGNADAADAVKEYYPAYTKEDGTRVAAINGEDTGIGQVAAESQPRDSSYYTLQGVRTATPKQGIYIKGNRKVVVR